MNYSDLEKLNELKEKNVITEEEFEAEKRKILSDKPSSSPSGFGKDLFGLDVNRYCMLMHLSQFLGMAIVGLGWVVPIGLWLINKDDHPTIDKHGKNIVNAIISYFIYFSISSILIIIMIGMVLIPVLAIVYLVSIIIAGLRAKDGQEWNYPLVIKFLK